MNVADTYVHVSGNMALSVRGMTDTRKSLSQVKVS